MGPGGLTDSFVSTVQGLARRTEIVKKFHSDVWTDNLLTNQKINRENLFLVCVLSSSLPKERPCDFVERPGLSSISLPRMSLNSRSSYQDLLSAIITGGQYHTQRMVLLIT